MYYLSIESNTLLLNLPVARLKYHQKQLKIYMERLDVRGKICPLPLFYVKRKISEMKPGEELEIIADDMTAKETIPKWSKLHEHEVVSIEDEGEFFRVVVKRIK